MIKILYLYYTTRILHIYIKKKIIVMSTLRFASFQNDDYQLHEFCDF